ncbi:hypothetical protein [Nonomuraea cavernae]|nr:hypothetical protein [Nonomuraea cavernae]
MEITSASLPGRLFRVVSRFPAEGTNVTVTIDPARAYVLNKD